MPTLDKGLEIFINWQTFVFCLGIYFATQIVRTLVEAFVPNVKVKGTKTYHAWNEAFLPLGPFGTGMLIALLAKKFPWPMPIADAMSAKLMYGLICGGASGFMYGRFRAFIRIRTESKDDGTAIADPVSVDNQPPGK
jgi:hypothetical protein